MHQYPRIAAGYQVLYSVTKVVLIGFVQEDLFPLYPPNDHMEHYARRIQSRLTWHRFKSSEIEQAGK